MVVTLGSFLSARRLVAVGIVGLGIAAVAVGALSVTASRAAFVHVRWAESVDDAMRETAEQRYSLRLGEQEGERTWGYTLSDVSPANVKALVTNGVVEGTLDIDRASFRISASAPRRPDPTLPPWIPAGLWGVTVLGLLVGASSISLGYTARAGEDTAARQFDRHPSHGQQLTPDKLTFNPDVTKTQAVSTV